MDQLRRSNDLRVGNELASGQGSGARRLGRGLAHQLLLDPDGRPRSLRRRDEF